MDSISTDSVVGHNLPLLTSVGDKPPPKKGYFNYKLQMELKKEIEQMQWFLEFSVVMLYYIWITEK